MLRPEGGIVLFQQLAHIYLPESNGDPINASFNPSPEIICLKRILRAKFTSPLGDYVMVNVRLQEAVHIRNIPSSCRLSISVCFWFRVTRSLFLGGLPVGVLASSTGYASSSRDFRLDVREAIIVGGLVHFRKFEGV